MSATPWLLRETNPEWRDDHDYTIGSCKRGSNGKIYFALKPSGPNSGGAQNPTTTDGYWVSLADSLKQGGINALLPEAIGAARGSRISATTPATAGWYRIAQSAVNINNCLGLLEITEATTSAHSATLLSAGISYGVNPVLIQHTHVPYSVPGLTKARIVYHKTYSGNYAYLEVYLSVAKAGVISVNMIGGQGWTLLAPSTAGGIPEGYSAAELTFVAGKIVGNVAGSVTGNAGTATKLATARTITLSGDATASGTFDGSANLTLTTTLTNSGTTAGSYGPTAAATLAFGGTVNIPQVTVDAKGRVTAVVSRAIKLPAAPTAVTGNAGTATKWATKRTVDGVQMDGSANVHHYGTCSTAAATAEKAVALTGFVLATGAVIRVKFTVTNTAANPTLNVNATGAKPVYYRGAAITAGALAANRTYEFVYNGTQYELVGDVDTNTTYSLATATKDGLMAKADKSKLDGIVAGAEVNQNAFSNILVGSTTIAADAKSDTLAFVAGSNVTLTPDAANDRLTIAAKDTTYGTATQSVNGLMSAADKKSVDYAEALRLSFIGVPRYWRSTTLPANHVWANGDLVLFSDWPELKKVYNGGGFNGMLLAYNADNATIAANLGKWRPNAANPSGLYVPKLSDQFFRAWTGGSREAGSYQGDAIRTIEAWWDSPAYTSVGGGCAYNGNYSSGCYQTIDGAAYHTFGVDVSKTVPTAVENRPINVALPVILYLGLPA